VSIYDESTGVGTNLFVSDRATPLIDDSNEICPEGAAE
jgi:hypothetical protein